MHLPMSQSRDHRDDPDPAVLAPTDDAPVEEKDPAANDEVPPDPREAPPADPDVPRASPEEREAMVRDPAVVALIRRAIAKFKLGTDAQDVVQDTLMAIVAAENLPTAASSERNPYVYMMAVFKAAEFLRKRKEVVAGDVLAANEQAAPGSLHDDVATRELFSKVVQHVPVGQWQTLRALAVLSLGGNLRELAEELEVPYQTLYSRALALRAELAVHGRKVLRGGGKIGSVFVLVLALFLGSREMSRPKLGFDPPAPISVLEPSVSTHVGQTDPMDWAALLRAQAFRSCMQNDWRGCLDGLDAAAELDPAGNDDPIVQAARSDANTGWIASLKGGFWQPQGVRVYASRAAR